jgi:hypothetical protein
MTIMFQLQTIWGVCVRVGFGLPTIIWKIFWQEIIFAYLKELLRKLIWGYKKLLELEYQSDAARKIFYRITSTNKILVRPMVKNTWVIDKKVNATKTMTRTSCFLS